MSQSPWIPPPNALFDLAQGNPRGIQHRRRIEVFALATRRCLHYLISEEKQQLTGTYVSLISASPLSIVRLDDELCDYNIARILLDQGSPILDCAGFHAF